MEEDYSTESESSDEDYNPAFEKHEQLSEIETDDDAEDDDAENVNSKNNNKSSRKRSKKQNKNVINKRNKKTDVIEDELSDDNKDCSILENSVSNEDDEKKRADALWANFLDDADTPALKPIPKISTKTTDLTESTQVTSVTKPISELKNNCETKKQSETITKIFDFAGEKVEIVTEVKPTNGTVSTSGVRNNLNAAPISNKRQSGGIGSILGQLGKKNKISTLEKSKLDWEGFKQKEGIDEEIQTHNKGKSGYLERQDFLERTDLRQFAQEKSLRQTKRNNR